MSDETPEDEIGPFAAYYHKNIAQFVRLLEASPLGTFSMAEIRANHYAAGGVLIDNREEIESLLDFIEQTRPPEGEQDEYEPHPGAADGPGSRANGSDPVGAESG